MAKDKEPVETIKIKSSKIAIARANKEKTGVPIARFIEDAIDEKKERAEGTLVDFGNKKIIE